MEDFNNNELNNENSNVINNEVNGEPGSEVSGEISSQTANEVNSEVSGEVNSQNEAESNPEAIDSRYAGYVDNNNVTWNGSSYSGRPLEGNTVCTTSSQPYDYQQNSYVRNYRYVSEPVMKPTPVKPPRKGMPKAVAVILLALLFGVVASGAFIGTSAIFFSVNPDAKTSAPDPFNHKGPDSIISNTPDGKSGNTEGGFTNKPGIISSTDIITDVNTSATDVSAVVDLAMPSIVSINCTFNAQSFFGTYETSGAGSGIILKQTDSELLVATNNHVVANAITINVTFDDGTTASAVTKGTDSLADLAVVAVDITELSKDTLSKVKVATLGDSDSIKVGQMVVAIGNAMGYGQSTTVGYVSAKDREVQVDGNTMTLLQTDAAINPGNSGGALLNLEGEVIGINSVKYASDDVEGMGFAIPISRATAILDELANREILKDEEKGYLGIYLQDVTSSMAEYYNMPIGVYVYELMDDSAAGKAGLEVGDIITAVNGHKVSTSTDLKNEVTAHRAGTTISVTFMRRVHGSYEEKTLDVTLGVNPEYITKD